MQKEEFEPVELIAILNGKIMDPTRILMKVDSSILEGGGLTAFVLGRLSKLSEQASTLARLKYADMQETRPKLVNMLVDEFYGHKQAKMIPLFMMSELVVMEVCDPRACRWCKGVCSFPETDDHGRETGRRIICGGCHGEGVHQWKDDERIKRLQVTEKDWKNNLSALYMEILDTCWGWDKRVHEVMG